MTASVTKAACPVSIVEQIGQRASKEVVKAWNANRKARIREFISLYVEQREAHGLDHNQATAWACKHVATSDEIKRTFRRIISNAARACARAEHPAIRRVQEQSAA